MKNLVKVIVDHKARNILSYFTYKVPPDLKEHIGIGSVVKVPFRKKNLYGWVIGYDDEVPKNVKDVSKVVLKEAFCPDEFVKLLEWLCSYYGVEIQEAVKTFFPVSLSRLDKKDSVFKEEHCSPPVLASEHFTGSEEPAIGRIKKEIALKKAGVFLIHALDSAKRLEVYLKCIEECIHAGRSSIVMVPEVFLTPQLINKFKENVFDFALFHSKMSVSDRLREWLKVCEGKVKVAIGTRSAVFAPFKDVGLIILDEEQDLSYKQEARFRYHARQVAIKRAALNNSVVLLGSATPSVETYYLAKAGKYHYISFKEKLNHKDSVEVILVDVSKGRGLTRNKALSDILCRELKSTLERGEKAVLILNRRGYHTFIACQDCGGVFRCPDCDVPLIYHIKEKKIFCHHCSYKEDAPDICPLCKGFKIKPGGFGVQKAEEEIKKNFPDADIARLDSDSKVPVGNYQILLGTQLALKDIDFKGVGLVGVVLADNFFNMPDFRIYERTYQLLIQAVNKLKGGKLIIQTYDVENLCLKAVERKDYHHFFNNEIMTRKEMRYPPYVHLVNCMFSSEDKEELAHLIENFLKNIKEKIDKSIEILGPSPCFYERLKKRHRWHIIFKTREVKSLVGILKENIKGMKNKRVNIALDVDPVSLH